MLSTWMRANLLAAFSGDAGGRDSGGGVEKVVLARLHPPLNIQHVQHQWKSVVQQARKVMVADC
ncbi:MAG: hypothetical protein K2X97_01320 [Mycobacteriaceae bacterium]|nr:hypothetical protein [Mycobacteriaceae bacterium]